MGSRCGPLGSVKVTEHAHGQENRVKIAEDRIRSRNRICDLCISASVFGSIRGRLGLPVRFRWITSEEQGQDECQAVEAREDDGTDRSSLPPFAERPFY